jgi:ankyrin repeat protein
MPEMNEVHDLAAAKKAVANMAGANGFDKKEAAAFLEKLELEHQTGCPDVSVWDAVGQNDAKLLAKILATDAKSLKSINRKIKDWQSMTSLHRACNNGYVECAQILLDKGKADIHIKDEDGSTPLHYATMNEDLKMAQMLIEYHAAINARDHDGLTPVMSACSKGSLEMVELLVRHGAKTDARSNDGYSAMHCAVSSGCLGILQGLLRHSSDQAEDMAVVDDDGLTLLHVSAAGGHCEILRFLLQNSADARIKDKKGRSALDWAVEEFEDGAVAIIREHLKSLPKPLVEGSNSTRADTLSEPSKTVEDPPKNDVASKSVCEETSDSASKSNASSQQASTGAKMAASHSKSESAPTLFSQLLTDAQGEVDKDRTHISSSLKGSPEAAVPPSTAALNEDSSFIPASTFQGAKPGFEFTTRAQGTGYYRSSIVACQAPEAPAASGFTKVDELD